MYITMIRSAKARGRAKAYGPYKHIALVELEPGFVGEPSMISARAKGVKRIVRDSGGLYAGGKTERSQWVRTVRELTAEAARLNSTEECPPWTIPHWPTCRRPRSAPC